MNIRWRYQLIHIHLWVCCPHLRHDISNHSASLLFIWMTAKISTPQITFPLWGDSIGILIQWIFSRRCYLMMTSSNGNLFRVTGLCAGNSPVTGEFPAQRPVTRSFDVFFELRLNKRLSKQSRRRCFETPLCRLWRHCNVWTGQWHVHSRVSSVPIHVWEISTLLMIMLTDIFQNSSISFRVCSTILDI